MKNRFLNQLRIVFPFLFWTKNNFKLRQSVFFRQMRTGISAFWFYGQDTRKKNRCVQWLWRKFRWFTRAQNRIMFSFAATVLATWRPNMCTMLKIGKQFCKQHSCFYNYDQENTEEIKISTNSWKTKCNGLSVFFLFTRRVQEQTYTKSVRL